MRRESTAIPQAGRVDGLEAVGVGVAVPVVAALAGPGPGGGVMIRHNDGDATYSVTGPRGRTRVVRRPVVPTGVTIGCCGSGSRPNRVDGIKEESVSSG